MARGGRAAVPVRQHGLGDAFLALGRAPIEIETQRSGFPAIRCAGTLGQGGPWNLSRGRTARIVGLLRQTDAREDVLLPKTLLARVVNPSGDVVDRFDVSLETGMGFEAEVQLPFGARQGRWSLDTNAWPGYAVLKSVPLRVADLFAWGSASIPCGPQV